MKKSITFILILLVVMHVDLVAQKQPSKKPAAYFRNAEKEFSDQRFMYAIPFYHASLRSGRTNDSLALLHLAECYWRIKRYDSATVFYKLYEQRFAPTYDTHQRLAELLAVQGKYKEAADTYNTLINDKPQRNGKMLKERFQGFSDLVSFLRDSLDYTIHLLKLNTKQQDFSPQYFRSGMVFVSNRFTRKSSEKQFGWDGLPYANIFWIKDTSLIEIADSIPGRIAYQMNTAFKSNDDYTERTSNDNDIININRVSGDYRGDIYHLAKFGDDLDTRYNYGPMCFAGSGNKVYFTRNSKKAFEGRYNLEICEADYDKGVWTNIRVMPFVQPAYDFYHPALSKDEQYLYFCSNKPDGFGGSDIYYVSLAGKTEHSVPFNLGEMVNTAGDELFPTIIDGELYYSSDGLAGLGGLDVFKTTIDDKGKWSKPRNLGYPINTSFDDFGLIQNDTRTKGYFTSNRLGTDDIYQFSYQPFTVEMNGTVFNKANMRRLGDARVVVEVIDGDKRIPVDTITTDLTGNFHFKARPHRDYHLVATKEGFTKDEVIVPAPDEPKPSIELQPLMLQPPAVVTDRDGDGVPDNSDKCPDVKGLKENAGCPDIQKRLNELAKMVFFNTDKSELLQKSMKPLNEAAEILKQYPGATLQIEGHTDSRASAAHNKALSQRRADAVKAFFVGKGLASSRFTAIGYGMERPVADNNTEEGRAINRRVEIKASFGEQ